MVYRVDVLGFEVDWVELGVGAGEQLHHPPCFSAPSVAVIFPLFAAAPVVAVANCTAASTMAALVGMLTPVEGVVLNCEVGLKGLCPWGIHKLTSGFARAETLGKVLALVLILLVKMLSSMHKKRVKELIPTMINIKDRDNWNLN